MEVFLELLLFLSSLLSGTKITDELPFKADGTLLWGTDNWFGPGLVQEGGRFS